MSEWKILGAYTKGTRLYVALERDNKPLTVYFEAGVIAALGCRGAPLYDGKPKKEGA